jgi:hypothetical protein
MDPKKDKSSSSTQYKDQYPVSYLAGGKGAASARASSGGTTTALALEREICHYERPLVRLRRIRGLGEGFAVMKNQGITQTTKRTRRLHYQVTSLINPVILTSSLIHPLPYQARRLHSPLLGTRETRTLAVVLSLRLAAQP